MELAVEDLPIKSISPNAWNPNKQSDRQFEAEIESILDNGFIAPILVRKVGTGHEIIDGEHRYKAMQHIAEQSLNGKGNVKDLVERQVLPCIVLNVTEAEAKKLTVIMNETRGRAELVPLSELLSELKLEFGDDLIKGLPYTGSQLNELLDIANFDWSDLAITESDFVSEGESASGYKVVALLDSDTEQKWKDLLQQSDLPKDGKVAAGQLIKNLIERA